MMGVFTYIKVKAINTCKILLTIIWSIVGFFIFSSGIIYAQSNIYIKGTKLTILSDTISIKGSLMFFANTSLGENIYNAGTIIISDSIKNYVGDLFKISSSNQTGSINLKGFKQQVVTGNGISYFNNLSLNNSEGLKLNQDIFVFGVLKLISGKLALNGRNISFYDLSPDVNLSSGTLYGETGTSFITDTLTLKPEGLLHAYSKAMVSLSKLTGFGADIYKPAGNLYLERGHRIIYNAGKGSIRKFFRLNSNDEIALNLKFTYFDLNDLKNTSLKEKELGIFSNPRGSTMYKFEGGARDTIKNIVSQTNLKTNSLFTLSSEYCPDPPDIDLGKDTIDICAGNSINLNATGKGISRIWYGSKYNILDTSVIYRVPGSPAGFRKFILKVYDERGCSNKDSVIIASRPFPLVSFSAPGYCCERDSLDIQNLSIISAGSINYLWILDHTDTFSTKNIQFIARSVGIANIQLKVSSQYGCSSALSKNIIVNPLPKASFESVDQCSDKTFLFTNKSYVSEGSAILECLWKIDNVLIDSFCTPIALSPVRYSFSQTGMKSVWLEVKSNAGCKSFYEESIKVFEPLKANFGLQGQCQGDSVKFFNTSTGGNQLNGFVWYFGDNSTYSGFSSEHYYAVPGKYLAKLYMHSTNNCFDSLRKEVPIYARPSVVFSNGLGCNKQIVEFLYSGEDSVSLIWSALGIKKTDRNPVYQFPDTGFFPVRLIAKSNYGCMDSAINLTYIYPLPEVSFELRDHCRNDSIIVIPKYRAADESFQWSLNQTPVSLSPELHILSNLSAGLYELNLRVQALNKCTANQSVSFRIFDLPGIELPSEIVTCGDQYRLNAGNEGSVYLWSDSSEFRELLIKKSGLYSVKVQNQNGCNNYDSCRIILNSTVSPNLGDNLKACDSIILHSGFPDANTIWSTGEITEYINVTHSGVYSVHVTDQNSCEGFDTVNIQIFPSPVYNLGADQVICGDSIITIGDFGNGFNYFWSDSTTSAFHQVSQSGIYTCRVEDINGCNAIDSVQITFEKLPHPYLPNEIAGCKEVKLMVNRDEFHYFWEDGYALTNRLFTQSGTYKIIVAGSHCQIDDSILVKIYPSPLVELGEDKFFCQGEGIFIGPAYIQSGIQYKWSNGISMPTIWIQNEGIYSLTVTDLNGCNSGDSIHIGISPTPVIKLNDQYWLCHSDSIFLDAGEPVNKYQWTENNKLISEMSYLWVSDPMSLKLAVINSHGCRADKNIEIYLAENPVFSRFLAASEAYTGDSIVFVNLSMPSPFSSFWKFGDGIETTLSDPVHAYYIANRYNPVLNVNNSYCQDYESKKILVRPNLKSNSLNESLQPGNNEQIKEILIYPNPASDMVNVRYEIQGSLGWQLSLYNTQGIVIFNRENRGTESGEITFSMGSFLPGLYFVVIQTSNERKAWRLMIIR
jgi:PKD repeat protein